MFANRSLLVLTFAFLLLFLTICQSEGTSLQTNSLIYRLSEKAATGNISELCRNQLSGLQRAAISQAIWAMKVLDASAEPTAGFIFGQNYWFGDQKTCEITSQPLSFNLSQPHPMAIELAPYPLNYRVFYINHQSRWQFSMGVKKPQWLHVGLCVPSACSGFELEHLLKTYLSERPETIFKHYDMKAEQVYSKNLKLSKSFFESKNFKWLTVLLAYTVVITLLAHVFVTKTLSPKLSNKWQQVLSCYALNDNWKELQPRANSQDIPILHGLRCIAAYTILAIHVIFFMFYTVDNSLSMQEAMVAITTQHSYLSSTVEIFFTISGFLFAMNNLSNAELIKNIREGNLFQNFVTFLKMIMRRYLRLAPMQFSVLLVAALSHAYFRDVSIFHVYDPLDEYCAKNWWHNLLFIQNLYPHHEMCGNWTWTTACDMQFFFVSTLAFFMYTKYPSFIKRLTLVALLSNAIFTFMLVYNMNMTLNIDAIYHVIGLYYTKPYTRILSYLVGCIYGAIYTQKLTTSLPIFGVSFNRSIVVVLIGIVLVLNKEPGQMAVCLIFIIGRLLVSMGVGWLIQSSINAKTTNERGYFLRVLESRIFQYISPHSYAIYMLNPVIIMGFSYAFNDTFKINNSLLLLLIFGFGLVTTCVAVVFTLFFELPYVKLTKLIFSRREKIAKISKNGQCS